MEEEQQGSTPRNRPASSASSRGRYTPQSSNGSFATNIHRLPSNMREKERMLVEGDEVRDTPGHNLLQDRLREKKAARLSERRPSTDANIPLDDRVVSMSSPIRDGSGAMRQARDSSDRPSSRGRMVNKKGMGMKEMEDTVSKLHKQNFDLKLALFHSRQRQTALEERVETAESQLEAQSEMQIVNEQLVVELEKRDTAVEEAVGIICNLEEKIARLEHERTIVQSFDAQYDKYLQDKGLDGPPSSELGSSPPRLVQDTPPKEVNTTTTRPVVRMPSFLSEQSEGAEALRSLYLARDQTFQSLPRLSEDGDKQQFENFEAMNSPRLSVLSESSFTSVYGEKNMTIESLDLDDRAKSPVLQKHRKSLSIEKWVDERPQRHFTPPRPAVSPIGNHRKGQFISLNDVLESPLQRLEKLERTLNRQNNKAAAARLQAEQAERQAMEKPRTQDKIRKTEMMAFESRETLPPTPDTISTSTLRRFKTSNDTLSHHDSDTRPQLDRTHTMPPLSRSNIRPRSAGETINSRRDGHGWDTAAPSEATSDAGTDFASSYDPWIAMGREKDTTRVVQPPDMFNFAAVNDEDDWGQDIMFNRHSGHYNTNNYDDRNGRLRGGNNVDDDNTPRAGRTRRGSASAHSPIATSPAFDNLPSPNPPQRRSSLANSPSGSNKYAKRTKNPSSSSAALSAARDVYQQTQPIPPPHAANPPTPVSNNSTMITKDTRRSRITSKLFGFGGSNSGSGSGNSNTTTSSYTNTNTNTNTANHPIPLPRTQSQQQRASSTVPPPQDTSRAASSYRSNHNHQKRYSANLSSSGVTNLASDFEAGKSATPPPISRYPVDHQLRSGRRGGGGAGAGAGGGGGMALQRPMTSDGGKGYGYGYGSRREGGFAAGGGENGIDGREGREYFGGMDGAGDEREKIEGGAGAKGSSSASGSSSGGRKWFGLGRSGSQKR